MSKRLGLSVVAASLLFGSAPGVAGGSTTSNIHSLATGSPGHDAVSARLASVGQAPVGHRQPRPSDVPRPRNPHLLIWSSAGWTKRSIAS